MSIQLIFLGTGTSHGVPMIGCKCKVCTSTDPHNHRMRTSALIKTGGKNLLVDTSPELRLQCLANDVERVDAVLYTHAHADHIFGLDDIRRFNETQNASIPCYGSPETLRAIHRAFEYIFLPTQKGGGKPKIEFVEISGEFQAAGITVIPIPVMHGEIPILGYRIGDLAYITDCSLIPTDSMRLLERLDTLVLGALRHQPHNTHFTLEQGIAVAKSIGARQTWFVHMSHGLDHETTNSELPAGMKLAYDGLIINI